VNVAATRRRPALRVAAMATVVVMSGYVLAAFILNMIVVDHLLASTDGRLTDRLQDMHAQALASQYTSRPAPADADLDDAPSFFWLVSHRASRRHSSRGHPPCPPDSGTTGR
jgi:hypothetical protein